MQYPTLSTQMGCGTIACIQIIRLSLKLINDSISEENGAFVNHYEDIAFNGLHYWLL